MFVLCFSNYWTNVECLVKIYFSYYDITRSDTLEHIEMYTYERNLVH